MKLSVRVAAISLLSILPSILMWILMSSSSWGDTSLAGGNATPTPSGAPPSAVIKSIPCVDDSGKVVNADPGLVCKATLSKCSDIYKTIATNVTNELALKIWGYYNGYDADLQAITNSSNTNVNQAQKGTTSNTSLGFSATIGGGITDVNKISWVGGKLSYPICSVIGHDTIGGIPTELTSQVIGQKISCGAKPGLGVNGDSASVKLVFDSTQGVLWNAYILGIKPWLYRRAAYEIFRGTADPALSDILGTAQPALAADLSNIGDIISSAPTAKQDLQSTLSQLGSFYSGMGPATQALCSQAPEGLLNACKTGTVAGGQSVNTLCMLYSAQIMVQNAAYSNLIMAEIFARANKIFNAKYAHILDQGNQDFKDWARICDSTQDGSGFALACSASCLVGGQHWCDGSLHDGDYPGDIKWYRSCIKTAYPDLTSTDFNKAKVDKPGDDWHTATEKFIGLFSGGSDGGTNTSATGSSLAGAGFAGFIEKIIRLQVCGQTDYSVRAPYCSVVPLQNDGGKPWGIASIPTAATPAPTPSSTPTGK